MHYPGPADKYESALEDLHSRHHWSTLKYQVCGICLFFLMRRTWAKPLSSTHPLLSLSDSQALQAPAPLPVNSDPSFFSVT